MTAHFHPYAHEFSGVTGVARTVNARPKTLWVGGVGGSTEKREAIFSPKKEFVPARTRGNEARNRAQQIFRPYSHKQLAEWADATPETAKCWKAGRCLPSFEKSSNLSRELPDWWAFVCEQAGKAEAFRHVDADFYEAQFAGFRAELDELKRRK